MQNKNLLRVHCTRVPGSPGFKALKVEVKVQGVNQDWYPIDVFSLDKWLESKEVREQMSDLIKSLESIGYVMVSDAEFISDLLEAVVGG